MQRTKGYSVGLDSAKSVFALHGTDEHGNSVLPKTERRPKLLELFAQLPGCLVGMKACSVRSTGRVSRANLDSLSS
jgi:transposase